MKNIIELRAELTKVFKSIKTGKTDVRQASEINNTAGKIISTVNLELKYRAQCKSDKAITFLDY